MRGEHNPPDRGIAAEGEEERPTKTISCEVREGVYRSYAETCATLDLDKDELAADLVRAASGHDAERVAATVELERDPLEVGLERLESFEGILDDYLHVVVREVEEELRHDPESVDAEREAWRGLKEMAEEQL